MTIRVPEKGWRTRAIFEIWWLENVIEFNLMAVNDPMRWGEIACRIESFQTGKPLSECSSDPPERFPPVTVW